MLLTHVTPSNENKIEMWPVGDLKDTQDVPDCPLCKDPYPAYLEMLTKIISYVFNVMLLMDTNSQSHPLQN